ncbi:MAG: hypothetical protein IJZ14_00660, partial [Oscillospiraceae bacterium]|nr:hypothetical protein [Oscillospiraceae bacterium]
APKGRMRGRKRDIIPSSVKNQRFLPASPQGEAMRLRRINNKVNNNLPFFCAMQGAVFMLYY